jgi:hypothetical protein
MFAAENAPAPAPAAGEKQTTGADSSEKVERTFPISGTGDLILTFPRGWNSSSRPMAAGGTVGQVILLYPKEGYYWILSIEAVNVGTNATKDLDTRKILAEAGKAELTNSVEKTLTIKDFKADEVSGSYFSLTDKNLTMAAPKDGQYKYLTQGYAKMDGVVLSFRLVSNKISAEDEKAALETIKSARFVRKKW